MPQEFTSYQVGKRFPGPIPVEEGAALGIHQTDASLHLIVSIDRPTPTEILQFRGTWELRIYHQGDMPGGLILLGMNKPGKPRWIHEIPFDAALEAEKHTESVLLRIKGEPSALYAFLVDRSTGILIAQRMRGLSVTFLKRIGELWGSQPDFGNYYETYSRLCAKSSEEIWAAAEIFPWES